MSTHHATQIVSLEAFRRKSELSKPAQKDERVWDRVERLYDLTNTQNQTNTSGPQRQETWESAVNALIQYIDNEWPIEKDNKIRANDIAEKASVLFVKGAFTFPQSKKSTDLQSKIIDAFEEQGFPDALNNYRRQTCALVDACSVQHQNPAP